MVKRQRDEPTPRPRSAGKAPPGEHVRVPRPSDADLPGHEKDTKEHVKTEGGGVTKAAPRHKRRGAAMMKKAFRYQKGEINAIPFATFVRLVRQICAEEGYKLQWKKDSVKLLSELMEEHIFNLGQRAHMAVLHAKRKVLTMNDLIFTRAINGQSMISSEEIINAQPTEYRGKVYHENERGMQNIRDSVRSGFRSAEQDAQFRVARDPVKAEEE